VRPGDGVATAVHRVQRHWGTAGADVDQAVCADVVARVTEVRDEIAERVVHLSRTRDRLTGFLNQARWPG